jgi:DNA-binding NarL/FixJ family response regulator
VLLDLQMPDLSGTEIAERLTRQFPAMRVIIVSVHDTAETQRVARLSGRERMSSVFGRGKSRAS